MNSVVPPFLSDEPLRGFNEEGRLELHNAHTGVVDGIAKSIVEATPRFTPDGPLTIAIYGPWGSGKTTMLRALSAEVSKRYAGQQGARRHPAVIFFEPWRHEKEPNLIIPLLSQMTASASAAIQVSNVKEALVKTGMRLIGRVAKATVRTSSQFIAEKAGLSGADIQSIGEEFMRHYEAERGGRFVYPESEIDAFKRDFVELIGLITTGVIDAQKRSDKNRDQIWIFIDDLDRCDPGQVKRLLESMKTFLWMPGVTYVLALDRAQVVTALAESHSRAFEGHPDRHSLALERAKHYIEKFFLYTVDLADGASRFKDGVVETVRSYFWEELQACWANVAQSTKSGNVTNPLNDEEVQKIFFAAGGNLRRLKRVSRWIYYELHMQEVRADFKAALADFVFSENYSDIWLKMFDQLSPRARASVYLNLSLALATLADPIDGTIDLTNNTTAVRHILRALHGSATQNTSGSDPWLQPLFAARDLPIGDFISQYLMYHDAPELNNVYILSTSASRLGKS